MYMLHIATEVHTPEQADEVQKHFTAWVGGRNAQNYSLIEHLAKSGKEFWIKRGPWMTTDETCGIYDIVTKIHGGKCHIVERGINTFDRFPESRWAPDLRGVLLIKHRRPDIFERMIVDCSHSVFIKELVGDVYQAFKAVGVKHFMFEAWAHPELAPTDKAHAISVKELEDIIR
jgi:3-deoxy-D-arabino-heptulosonate 7-phosphate (DAHP) synthase